MAKFFARARLPGVAGVLGALLIAGVAAGAAGGALILGQANDSGTAQTTLTNAGLGAAFTLKTTNVSTNATGIFGWSSQTGTNVTNGVLGRADGPNSYGVNARNSGANGNGAALLAEGNNNFGIIASGTNTAIQATATGCSGFICLGAVGVAGYGYILGSGVMGVGFTGVYGSGDATGVFGAASAQYGNGVYGSAPTGTGVYGAGESAGSITGCGNGAGYFCSGGRFTGQNGVVGQAQISNGVGVIGVAGVAGSYGINSVGPAYIAGDLTVTGAKTGYVADYAVNGSNVTIRQGDALTLLGVRPAVVGSIPLLVVGPAKAGDRVIGVADRKMNATPSSISVPASSRTVVGPDGAETTVKTPARKLEPQLSGFFADGTSIKANEYLLVVTLGAFAYGAVDASGGAILVGDELAAGATAGRLTKATTLTVDGQSFVTPGTSVGYALGALNDGTGRIAIFVSPH